MAVLAWQGWQLSHPPRRDPIKLEGGFDVGYALLADTHRPRLAIRWRTLRARDAKADRIRRAMRDEVGILAAGEATELAAGPATGLLYVEPHPPGRDVWVGFCQPSRRLLQVVYHVHRRDLALAEEILPSLLDASARPQRPWAVFDLSCTVPSELRLTGRRLNAGDLALSFSARRRQLSIRQLAVAQLALSRMPLRRWLAQHQSSGRMHYRSAGEPDEVTIDAAGRVLSGLRGRSVRRRRFAWMRWLPAEVFTYALHDAARDRLIFVESNDAALAASTAATVGWARPD